MCNAPNQVKNQKLNTNIQKAKFIKGLKEFDLIFVPVKKGNVNYIRIAENIAITPPNLLGTHLKIA